MTRRLVLVVAGVSLGGGFCSRRQPGGKVEVGYRVIRYTEPAGTFELDWEPREGKPPVAYVPTARRWREEMPEWAANRRDELLPEIKRQTKHMNFTWEEYD